MKKSAVFIFTALIIIMLVVAACAPAAQGKKLIVAIDATYPPFEQLNEKTGQLEGFSVDLMNAVAAKAVLDFEWVNVSYDKVLAGVASCQYDLACSSVSITEDRKKDMLFSDPINSGGQVVIVRKDNTDIKSKDDLTGKSVAALTAATSAIEAGKIPGVKVKTFTTLAQVFQAIIDGQCDAAIADNMVSAVFTKKYPDKLKVVGPIFTDEIDGIAICQKNEYLVPKINAALKALRDDGTIDKLRIKWIGGE